LALFERVDRLGAFDAVLAAAAASSGAAALVSADTAFADAGGVAHIVADATGIASLLKQ
jgi:predicted nucleic acid-binding protein